ncbi:SLAP domain-containing protein [Lactobacillus crispatus]|uniref:SLAP domain-containing protein n=1 Tax=Lactobacillus crispatus TaxID=47770 RepID=UPI001788AB16|nr:SLAP domain-containing protein [Lactobacillus crispatus]
MKYFRNDKLDLVNKEKQRFGFRKLSSGKIASVLLGVTIFGSFALNGQVVKANTTTDGSQPTAVVDEAESTQNNEEQGVTATFNEEQSGQDTSAQNDGSGEESHEAQTRTVTPGTTSGSEAETGKTKADSTGTDSDKNGAGAAKVRALVLAQMPEADQLTAQEQPTAQKQPTAAELVKTYPKLTEKSAQKLLDYYNNLGTVTAILDLDATSYGSGWLEQVFQGQGSAFLTDAYVDKMIETQTGNMVTAAKGKIDNQIKKLTDLASQYPNNQEIKDAIAKLNAAKDSMNEDSVTNAAAMKDAIDALNKYGSKDAYKKLEDAAKHPAVVDKDGLKSAVAEADTVKGDSKYYNAKNKDDYDKALAAAQKVIDNPAATQQEVDDAKKALADAKTALNGSATDKDALQKDVDDSRFTKTNDQYYNASQDKKQAYDKALAQAEKLLNDKTASQKAVDDAVANLEKAKAELNGEPNFIGGDYTPSEPSTPSTETPAEKTTEKILMHASYLYDNKGIKIDKPTVKSYVTVVVAENPVTINGIKYYKVAGKDEYIKAGNIDGTLRVITHNSYIYNNKGKATRNKGIKRLVKKTRVVRTYGAPINIKGHMMYRIAKNRYIKARNFEGTLRRLSHNSFVYDENGKATRNKGIRRLLKKSRVVRTFDAPVKINGHMMYRVDNGYVKVKNFK